MNTKSILSKLHENMEIYKNLVDTHVSTERKSNILQLIDSLGERIGITPYSSKQDYSGCFVGGLVDQSLRTLKHMIQLNKVYRANISSESLVVTALFSELGKIGNKTEDYYMKNNSDWHNKRGIMYDINESMTTVPSSQRSLFLLQSFGIPLTEEEYQAIASIKDRLRSGEENLPATGDTLLSIILQQAIKITSFKNKNRTSVLTDPSKEEKLTFEQ